MEITRKRFMLLLDLEEEPMKLSNCDGRVEDYKELVEEGYIEKLESADIMYDYEFKITDKGIKEIK